MCRRIIYSFKKDIFKRDSSLAVKIEITDYIQHLFDSIGTLNRHKFSSLFVEWRMQTYCKMTPTFFQKLFYTGYQPYCTYSDPCRAPGVSPFTCKNIKALKYFSNII